ncbi:MAG: TetR/AcrR family transcriptional regulator [Acidimicrobiales bacterium]
MTELAETMARRAVDRAVADRHGVYLAEMQRIVDATYELMGRTGRIDPSLREILRETGLSTQAFYRYFKSKDELLLLLLDDGRRRLVSYLEHRMARASAPADEVREWIAGVLAQAARADVAARTRPFVVNQDRLAEAFPVEQQASVDLLVELLTDPIGRLGLRPVPARAAAEATYRVTFATLHDHITRGTRPTPAEVDSLTRFCLGGIAASTAKRS